MDDVVARSTNRPDSLCPDNRQSCHCYVLMVRLHLRILVDIYIFFTPIRHQKNNKTSQA